MIQNTYLLTLILVGLVFLILELEKQPAFAKLFHYLPSPFWCYFLPMILATLGILPEQSSVYTFLTTYLLSGCLILLLLNINLPAILRLGPTALGTMTVGALGIALGAVGAYAIFGRWLPPETWKGVGALSASWTGGSANMLAVKEGLQTPDSVFAPMIIVDTVVTYSWMGLLIALAVFQDRWDRWVKADRSALEDVVQRLSNHPSPLLPRLPLAGPAASKESVGRGPLPSSGGERVGVRGGPSWLHAVWLIGGSMLIGAVCLKLGSLLPRLGQALNPSGWAFLLVTFIGISLSLTPAAKLEKYGASRWGYLCLYLLLAAMGSKARLQYIVQAPLLIVMGYVWVLIHASMLLVYGYFFRVPMFFLVTSSQANIGGTASAPIVAGIYQPRLATLGLLLAISANVVGTYCGYLIAEACRWTHP